MQLFKFSLAFILLLDPPSSFSAFKLKECLEKDFVSSISHKVFPLGLLSRKLIVEKKSCLLTISHEKYKFLKNRWEIDVCRAPVHIKESDGGVTVYKRAGACDKKQSDYCEIGEGILEILQDDGLIFADGEKENINSDHGRIYCSFLVVKQYLMDGHVFSKDENRNDIFSSTPVGPVASEKEIGPAGPGLQEDGPADF